MRSFVLIHFWDFLVWSGLLPWTSFTRCNRNGWRSFNNSIILLLLSHICFAGLSVTLLCSSYPLERCSFLGQWPKPKGQGTDRAVLAILSTMTTLSSTISLWGWHRASSFALHRRHSQVAHSPAARSPDRRSRVFETRFSPTLSNFRHSSTLYTHFYNFILIHVLQHRRWV